jgi:hypothetical protein
MNRVFGVRAVASASATWPPTARRAASGHRLWLLSDVADTAMGAAMVARGELTGPTAIEALTLTAGSAAVDLASLARSAAPGDATLDP